jgi:hypothetical protein
MRSVSGRWYAPNTRESIRDETLRAGLVALGAVIERTDLPTTSARPRYALARDFAEFLDRLHRHPDDVASTTRRWQRQHLTPTALNRIQLLRRGTVHSESHRRVAVTLPSGETRLMLPGPSTEITKAVVEVFAPRFLREPGLVFLSESGNKAERRYDDLAKSIGLRLDYSRNLPDIVLADVGPRTAKVVFVEVVATDGAVTEVRRRALLQVASDAGYSAKSVFFVSAFLDRSTPAFRRLVADIAWGTYAWFASEPDRLVLFSGEGMTDLPGLSGTSGAGI